MNLQEQTNRIRKMMGLNESTNDSVLESVDATAEALIPKLKDRQNAVTLRRLTNLIAHNGDSVITKFDKSKIKGGMRGRYGVGYYFSNLFKNYDYGQVSTYLNAEPLKLLNGNKRVSEIMNIIIWPNKVTFEIYRLEELLYKSKNIRDYNEIKNEIENLNNIKSKFDRNSEYIQKALKLTEDEDPNTRFDIFLESIEWRVQEANGLNKMSAVPGLYESMNNLLIMIGYDGINVDDGREILLFPQDNKLNDLLVPSQELFISEKYHEAKTDGSNPELVGAVEKLLGQK